jgi:hypothetical protein
VVREDSSEFAGDLVAAPHLASVEPDHQAVGGEWRRCGIRSPAFHPRMRRSYRSRMAFSALMLVPLLLPVALVDRVQRRRGQSRQSMHAAASSNSATKV